MSNVKESLRGRCNVMTYMKRKLGFESVISIGSNRLFSLFGVAAMLALPVLGADLERYVNVSVSGGIQANTLDSSGF